MSAYVANGLETARQGAPNSASRLRWGVADHLAGILCLSLVFTLSGAFDTDNLGVLHRWGLWLVVASLIVGQASGLDGMLRRVMPGGALLRFLTAGIAIAATVVLMTFELDALKFTPLLPKARDPIWDFLLFVGPPVSAVAAFVVWQKTAFARRASRRSIVDRRTKPAPLIVGRPIAIVLLPPPTPAVTEQSLWPDAPVVSVQALDHYLEVVTHNARILIRGRMKDAMARLEDADGLQIHRSWWISSAAVAGAKRAGRDHVLVLADGREIPIARSRFEAVRGKGWI